MKEARRDDSRGGRATCGKSGFSLLTKPHRVGATPTAAARLPVSYLVSLEAIFARWASQFIDAEM
jgi:hypothetical protein